MKSPLEALGELIRARRQELNLTQSDIAGDDLSTAYISQVERGMLKPSYKALRIISRRLGLPFRELEMYVVDNQKSLLIEYCLLRAELLVSTGQYERALEELQLLDSYSGMDSESKRGHVQLLKARINLGQRNYHEAQRFVEAGLESFREAGDSCGVFRAQMEKVRLLKQLERFLPAIELLQDLREHISEYQCPDVTMLWEVTHELGSALLSAGETARAVEVLNEAEHLAQQICCDCKFADQVLQSAEKWRQEGRLMTAVTALMRSEAQFGFNKRAFAKSRTLLELARAAARQRDLRRAGRLYDEALLSGESGAAKRLKIKVTLERAKSLYTTGPFWMDGYTEAACLAKEVLQLIGDETEQYPLESSAAHFLLAQVARVERSLDEAKAHYHKALQYLTDLAVVGEVRRLQVSIYNALASVAEFESDLDQAMEYYRRASELEQQPF